MIPHNFWSNTFGLLFAMLLFALYIVAVSGEKKSLVKISADGKMSTLTGSELFQKFTVSSLVEWRGSIYCASKTGILAFDPTNEKETWYPIDWRKLDN